MINQFGLVNYKKINPKSFKAYDLRVFAKLLALQEEQPSPVWDYLIDKVMTIVRKSEKESLDIFQSQDDTAESWAMKAAFNLLGPELETGRNHFCRGSLTFRGEEFFTLYRFLSKKLVESGIISQEWADNDAQILYDNIATVG